MPDKIIEIPSVGRIAFPDSMTDAQINAAATKLYQEKNPTAKQPPVKSWVDTAVDWLPTIGGTAGALIGGAGGTVAGMAVGGIPGAVGGAAVGGAAGEAAKELINSARGKAAPTSAGEAATNIAGQAALQGGLEMGGAALMKGVAGAGTAVYRGFLKPSLAGSSINRAQEIVKTALDEGLPISQMGKERALRIASELKGRVESILQSRQNISKNLHGDIDLHDVADQVRSYAQKVFNKPGRPPGDFEAAMRVADQIDAHPSVGVSAAHSSQPVTLTEANTVKQTLDKSIGSKAFGEIKGPAVEAEKQGRYALRQAIETRAPEVAKLNEREGRLLDVAKALKHAVEREANQNRLVGVKTLAAGALGTEEYGRTGDPVKAAAAAMLTRAALNPALASQVAILASRIGKSVPGTAPASAVRLAIAALSSDE